LMKYFKPLHWQTVNETRQTNIEDELRHRLIAGFVRDNQNRFNEIAQALNAGDITLAHRLAHTLKSNAGYFGKKLLQKTAADIEAQLKDGQNKVSPQQLATLETELKAALVELAAEFAATTGENAEASDTLNNEPEPARDETVGTEFVKELFTKLKPMLEMGSLGCREFIGNLSAIPGTDELIRQIDDLDFDQALVTLEKLMEA